jgi:hypothetical protein
MSESSCHTGKANPIPDRIQGGSISYFTDLSAIEGGGYGDFLTIKLTLGPATS